MFVYLVGSANHKQWQQAWSNSAREEDEKGRYHDFISEAWSAQAEKAGCEGIRGSTLDTSARPAVRVDHLPTFPWSPSLESTRHPSPAEKKQHGRTFWSDCVLDNPKCFRERTRNGTEMTGECHLNVEDVTHCDTWFLLQRLLAAVGAICSTKEHHQLLGLQVEERRKSGPLEPHEKKQTSPTLAPPSVN